MLVAGWRSRVASWCMIGAAGPGPAGLSWSSCSSCSSSSSRSSGNPRQLSGLSALAPKPVNGQTPNRHAEDWQPWLGFHLATSSVGKDSRPAPSRQVFDYSRRGAILHKAMRPNRPDSGHDAFFVSPVGQTGALAMGVADGVGGWVDLGIDPGVFSQSLMYHMRACTKDFWYGGGDRGADSWPFDQVPLPPGECYGEFVLEVNGPDVETVERQLVLYEPERWHGWGEPPVWRHGATTGHVKSWRRIPTARQIMEAGYVTMCRQPAPTMGGSTACVAVAMPDGTVDVANLGDSGYMVLQPGMVKAWSTPQTHGFNHPFQLSYIPPGMRRDSYDDLPADADQTVLQLQRGDVLVLATDGVWDNLSKGDVRVAVSRYMDRVGAWTHAGGEMQVSDQLEQLVDTADMGALVTAGQPEWKPRTLQAGLAAELTREAWVASVDRYRPGPFARAMHQSFPREYWRGGKVDDICVVVAVVAEDPGKDDRDRAEQELKLASYLVGSQ